jgi:hypothetical protein
MPGVRSLGQKRVHLSFVRRPGLVLDPASIDSIRWTQSFPRTRMHPDARIEDNKKGRLKAASEYAARRV